MVVCRILVTFFLSINLFNQVSAQANNFTDILDKQNESVLQAVAMDTNNTFGLKNNSYYEDECDCGFGSLGCLYNLDNEKVCYCKNGYSQYNGKCERCYCGVFEESCTYKNNEKVCTCLGNYLQNDYGQCAQCDCGYNVVSCRLKGFFKECTCREGYVVKDGKCEECDCGYNSISCELTSDKYTRCTCVAGYVSQRKTRNGNDECKLPSVSQWRIAIYFESVFFILLIIVCTIIICCKNAIRNCVLPSILN